MNRESSHMLFRHKVAPLHGYLTLKIHKANYVSCEFKLYERATCPTMKVKSVRKRWHMESKIEGEGEVAKGGEDVTAAT